MDFIHKRIRLETRQAVEVELDRAANVLLLTEANFLKYKKCGSYEYYGGEARKTQVSIFPGRAGNYQLVIDLGGRGGAIRYTARIVDCQ